MEFGWLTLLPPLLAIALALVTREVYSSLLIGVLAGSFIINDFNLLKSIEASLTLMFEKAGDPELLCLVGVINGNHHLDD